MSSCRVVDTDEQELATDLDCFKSFYLKRSPFSPCMGKITKRAGGRSRDDAGSPGFDPKVEEVARDRSRRQ
jgi:hypothetical protein